MPQDTMTNRHDVPPGVYLVIQTLDSTTTVLGVFADLQDANEECLRQATLAGVTLAVTSTTMGPDRAHHSPVEPMRWDTPEGDSCYVEMFAVTPRRIVTTAMQVPGKA